MAKERKVAEKKIVEEPAAKPVTRTKDADDSRPRWGVGSVFWGLLLITIGILALLSNFGLVTLNLVALAQLWPLLLIVWGVSMLSIRSMLWRAVMIGLVVLTLGLVAWVAVGGVNLEGRQSVRTDTQTVGQLTSDVKQLDLSVEAGASKMTVNSKEMTDTVRATLNSSVASLKRTSDRRGDTQQVTLKLESTNMWWLGGPKNDLEVTLSRSVPTVLMLKAGATELKADLRDVILDRLRLELGASSADVTLGDLRDDLNVDVDAGASTVQLHLPRSLGVRVTTEGGASSNQFGDLVKKGDGVYESSNYASATKKVTITGDTGATTFKINRF